MSVKPYCPKCAGTGKLDRGNGTTKPCQCGSGLIERARRRTLADDRKLRARESAYIALTAKWRLP
jgi:DnaJ-class molecular chaperone